MGRGNPARQRKRTTGGNKVSSSLSRASSSSRAGSRGWILAFGALVGIVAVVLGVFVIMTRRHVATPLGVPPVISPNMVNTTEYQMRLWGTYRSNLYFGIRPRLPQSVVAGLMWFSYGQKELALRHSCEHDDRLPRYGWLHHDGVMYGEQEIVDHGFSLTTQFVKGSHDSWTARISGQSNIKHQQLVSVILYLYNEAKGSSIQATTNSKGAVTEINGETIQIGRYKVTLSETAPQQSVFNHLVTEAGGISQLTTTIRQVMRQAPPPYEKWPGLAVLPGNVDYFPSGGDTVPNLVAYQLTTLLPFTVEMTFQSGDHGSQQPPMENHLTQLLDEHRKQFDDRFEKTFHLYSNNFTKEQVTFAKAAFSNLIGGISYFYGSSMVQSLDRRQPTEYWPTPLYTGVPSRSFFPRGFLWDEGFHQILVAQWNLDITKDVIGHWMDTVNWEGWLPREQILGEEAASKVPKEFVIQHSTNGNPPTFFLTLNHVIRLMKEQDQLDVPYLKRLFPRIQAWYNWFNRTQEGPRPLTYRWKGRNETTDRELNPKTLTSGLDDYPRASHPSNQEYHIDLRCWMTMASATMATIAEIVGADPKPYKSYHKMLSDNEQLNRLHWDEENEQYSDYGLHSSSVKMVRVKSEKPGGPEYKIRRVVKQPTERQICW
ncbi:mannosyl-oligosaccharide glucosidase-like isoform X2 [Dysidea avara]|uniref:mannosyl-oligosaccharide glucosidase-like isoform X2 n=1 Tax=Dysidea avara TaxID=196820 RepID=UPI0033172630